MEIITFLQTCDKQKFIDYAKKFNVHKTTRETNYLLVKTAILNLLEKHNLTIEDIQPEVKQIDTRIYASSELKNRINTL
jgi:uncharacterized protein YoxC